MKNTVKKLWLFMLACDLVVYYAHALGDGPRVDELLGASAVVCAGKFTGYDIASVNVGQTSVWVVAEFTIDHVIKGKVTTNKVGILTYQLGKDDETNTIRHLLSPPLKTRRCLFFGKEIDKKAAQYVTTDNLNGILPACENKPIVRESADTKERLSVELNWAYNELATGERELLELIAGDWLKTRKEPKPKLKDIRGKP
jgi:hypothetical protein